jgi:cytochrome c oxidase subunit IV
MTHTVKKALAAALIILLALAIFFACVGANGIARWSFALFIITAAGTIVAAIFRSIDNGDLDIDVDDRD